MRARGHTDAVLWDRAASGGPAPVTIHEVPPESPDALLDAWHQVYAGLTDEEIAQIETLALDRQHFMRQEP